MQPADTDPLPIEPDDRLVLTTDVDAIHWLDIAEPEQSAAPGDTSMSEQETA